jgi:hypothetical protein
VVNVKLPVFNAGAVYFQHFFFHMYPFSDWSCQMHLRQTARQNIQREQSLVDGWLSDHPGFIEL